MGNSVCVCVGGEGEGAELAGSGEREVASLLT